MVVSGILDAWGRDADLHIADTLSDRGCDKHRCRSDRACHEEDSTELALGQAELAVEEVCHPGSIQVSPIKAFLVSAMTYRDASPDAKESIPNKMNNRITSDHRSLSIDANKDFFGAGSCSTGA